MESIVLIGGGGHCHSCIDVIESQGTYKIEGIIDKKELLGKEVMGYKVIGTDDDIPYFAGKFTNFLITVGQIKSPKLRVSLYEQVLRCGGHLPLIVSPRAYVSKYADIGRGTIVMNGAIINANCIVGENCIINSKALCEHDVMIGNHCHISTASVINGGCIVKNKVFVGSNACLKHNSVVESDAIIPFGSIFPVRGR